MGKKYREVFFVLLIVVLGLALRGMLFNNNSFWHDEGSAVYHATVPFAQIPLVHDLNPPLYYILLHVWMSIAKTEVALRLLSVLFGVLSIIAMYWLGKILVDHRAGLISALLLALSPFNIYYSWELRTYSLLCFFSLLSVFFFLKIVEEGATPWPLCLYIICTCLGLYAHYCILLVLVIENIFWVAYGRRSRLPARTWLMGQGIVLLLYLPWLPYFVNQYSAFAGVEDPASSLLKTALPQAHLFLDKLLQIFFDYSSFCYLPGVKPWIVIVFGFLSLQGCIYLFRNKPRSGFFLVLYILFPLLFYTVLIEHHRPLSAKYLIGFGAGYYVFLACGLLKLQKIKNRLVGMSLFYLLLGAVIAINILSLRNTAGSGRPDKENWRGVSGYLTEKADPADVIVLNWGTLMMPTFQYYYKASTPCIGLSRPKDRRDKKSAFQGRLASFHDQEADALSGMLAKKYGRIWVIRLPFQEFDATAELLKRHFELKETRDFGVIVSLYENKNSVISTDNPCRLRYSVAPGESVCQTIEFPDAGLYALFIPAQSAKTAPFFCGLDISVDKHTVDSRIIPSTYPEIIQSVVFAAAGPHQACVTFTPDAAGFNKERRLLCGEIMYDRVEK